MKYESAFSSLRIAKYGRYDYVGISYAQFNSLPNHGQMAAWDTVGPRLSGPLSSGSLAIRKLATDLQHMPCTHTACVAEHPVPCRGLTVLMVQIASLRNGLILNIGAGYVSGLLLQ